MNFFSNKKRFLVLGTTVILLSLTFFFNSCEKELKGAERTTEESSERMKKVVLSPYNQKLLEDFLTKTKQYLKSSNLNTRTAYSMMQFTDEGGYNAYNTALDDLSNQWDNTNGQPIPAGDDFLILDNPGDPAYNAVDYAFGLQSTRYDYAYNSQFDRNWNTSDPEVTDYYFQRVMNLNEEVQVGEYIYKQVEDGFIIKISAYDAAAINDVRQNGMKANVDMEVLDEGTGTVNTVLQTRGACTVKFKGSQVTNTTNAHFDWTMFDLPTVCGGKVKLNFGDGTGDVFTTDGGITHAYDVPIGTSKSFKATLKVIIPGCASCTNATADWEVTINNSGPCHEGEYPDPKLKWIDFAAKQGGVNRNASIGATFEYRGRDGGFLGFAYAKIWLKTRLEVQQSNGSWKTATPAVPIVIDVFGKIKSNNCLTPSILNKSESITSCEGELLLSANGGILPSRFGISENINETLFGRVTFGPVVYSKDFWHWDN
jgi:hypothetical protein